MKKNCLCKTGVQNQSCPPNLNEVFSGAVLAVPGPTGPTGPTGATGPAGTTGGEVYVRSTTTVDPGNDATILSSKENDVMVLDFFIPRGEPGEADILKVGTTTTVPAHEAANVLERFEEGNHLIDFYIPKGETGADGEKGETGIGEKISIDRVFTLNPGEAAAVEDNFVDNVHHLTFFIPSAEYKNNKSVAELIKNSQQTISRVNTPIEFETATNYANSNVSQTEIEILTDGIYKVEFGVCVEVQNETTISLFLDNTPVDDGTLLLSPNSKCATRSLIMDLEEHEKLSLVVIVMGNSFSFETDRSFAYLNIVPVAI